MIISTRISITITDAGQCPQATDQGALATIPGNLYTMVSPAEFVRGRWAPWDIVRDTIWIFGMGMAAEEFNNTKNFGRNKNHGLYHLLMFLFFLFFGMVYDIVLPTVYF